MKIKALQTYQSVTFGKNGKQETHFNNQKQGMEDLKLDLNVEGGYVRVQSARLNADVIIFAANIAYAAVDNSAPVAAAKAK